MPSTAPVIDVHSHFMPPGYTARVAQAIDRDPPQLASVLGRIRQPAAPMTDLQIRLDEMERSGVTISVLSLPPPGVTVGDPAARGDLARLANDEFLEAAGQHTGRLAVLVALPLPDVEASLAELDRVAGHVCACGINLQASTADGWTIDDPAFLPVYLRAAELGLPVLVHPAIETLPPAWTDFLLGATLAPMVSSSLSVARLILSGRLDQIPDLQVIVPHLGGVLPYLTQRFADFGRRDATHDFDWYLRERLFYDTCSYHPPAFRCALDTCGVDRLILGTDYPVRGPLQRGVDDIQTALVSEAERRLVLGVTASRWFGLEPAPAP
jgi:predicted TIM-barrel fold metal-dependent hydrolase